MDIAVKHADVVVMGMLCTENGLTIMKGIREMYGKPVVMEIDDNIASTPTYNPASEFYNPDSKLREIAIRQMREADAVIVTTPYLKEVYKEFNNNIYVMPNSIDFEEWGKAQRRAHKGKIVIGWAGGASHNEDLAILNPVIDHFGKKYGKKVEFRIVHGISPELKDKPNVKWVTKFEEILKYPQHIAKQGFDIAVAPLVDNAFNRAKSNLRWLEAAAFSVPCVASNVGHFADTITHGENGFLCDNSEDFIIYLENLVNNKSLRKDIGRAALCHAYDNFNVARNVQTYASVLNDIINRGQVKMSTQQEKESNYKSEAEII
jgi:glycosyltransferase involved in cell wall biosynthesis